MTTHELKTDPDVFEQVFLENKNFEIRKDDREFKVGDGLYLRETKHTGAEMAEGAPLEYTGRSIGVGVQYILRGPIYGLQEGWVIMDIAEK